MNDTDLTLSRLIAAFLTIVAGLSIIVGFWVIVIMFVWRWLFG